MPYNRELSKKLIARAQAHHEEWLDDDWILFLDVLYPTEVSLLYPLSKIGNSIDDILPYTFCTKVTAVETMSRLKKAGIVTEIQKSPRKYEVTWVGLSDYCRKNFDARLAGITEEEVRQAILKRLEEPLELLLRQLIQIRNYDEDLLETRDAFLGALFQEFQSHRPDPLQALEIKERHDHGK